VNTTLSDEHLRALRFLARHPNGFTEATLLDQGFTVVQLSYLVYVGLAKLRRPGPTTAAFRVRITMAGRKAIAERSARDEGEDRLSSRARPLA
jgi:hypothetical protein